METITYEALIVEHTFGSTKAGQEIIFTKDQKQFAKMLGEGSLPEVRQQAQEIIDLLNNATAHGARPPKIVREDRGKRYDEEVKANLEHAQKTIDLNMTHARNAYDLMFSAIYAQKPGEAIRWAAECYAIRSFVTGVIRGRLYKHAEGEIESRVRKWEDQWDQAFGDLVGKTLKMQD